MSYQSSAVLLQKIGSSVVHQIKPLTNMYNRRRLFVRIKATSTDWELIMTFANLLSFTHQSAFPVNTEIL